MDDDDGPLIDLDEDEKLEGFRKLGVSFISRLGGGTYGQVYKVIYNGQVMAIKIMKNYEYAELDVSSSVDNPYVLYNHMLFLPTVAHTEDMGVLLPLAESTAAEYINGAYTFSERLSFFRKILEGIACLHANGIFHLDLKPANILVQLVQRQYFDEATQRTRILDIREPLISDFGLSLRTISIVDGTFSKGTKGTINHRPPEGFMEHYPVEMAEEEKINRRGSINYSFDMWSMGIIAFSLLLRIRFFPEKIRRDGYKPEEVYLHLLEKCGTAERARNFITEAVNTSAWVPKDRVSDTIRLLLRMIQFDRESREQSIVVLTDPIFKDIITPVTTCSHRTIEVKIPNKEFARYPDIIKVAEIMSVIWVNTGLSRMDMTAFFHSYDLLYRYFTIMSPEIIETITPKFYYSLALGMIWGSIRMRNYNISPTSLLTAFNKIFNTIALEDKIVEVKEFIVHMDRLLHLSNGIVYRRHMYEETTSRADLGKYYTTYFLNPELYYTYVPKSVDPQEPLMLKEEGVERLTIADLFGKK